MKAVAGEHSFSLTERFVDGRLAAPEVRIVHARQVVVDQRIDVDRFDRTADAHRTVAVDREQPRRRDGKQRSKAFAAPNRRMAHGLEQPFATVVGRR